MLVNEKKSFYPGVLLHPLRWEVISLAARLSVPPAPAISQPKIQVKHVCNLSIDSLEKTAYTL